MLNSSGDRGSLDEFIFWSVKGVDNLFKLKDSNVAQRIIKSSLVGHSFCSFSWSSQAAVSSNMIGHPNPLDSDCWFMQCFLSVTM